MAWPGFLNWADVNEQPTHVPDAVARERRRGQHSTLPIPTPRLGRCGCSGNASSLGEALCGESPILVDDRADIFLEPDRTLNTRMECKDAQLPAPALLEGERHLFAHDCILMGEDIDGSPSLHARRFGYDSSYVNHKSLDLLSDASSGQLAKPSEAEIEKQLFRAVAQDDVATVSHLASMGVSLKTARNDAGQSLLQVAIQRRRTNVQSYLESVVKNRPCKIKEFIDKPMPEAPGSPTAISEASTASASSGIVRELFRAVMRDDVSAVEQLAASGVNLLTTRNVADMTALQFAKERGKKKVRAYLKQKYVAAEAAANDDSDDMDVPCPPRMARPAQPPPEPAPVLDDTAPWDRRTSSASRPRSAASRPAPPVAVAPPPSAHRASHPCAPVDGPPELLIVPGRRKQ